MRVMCILGSPRKGGNTAKVLNWVEEELDAQGHEVDHVHIADYEVRGCGNCQKCQETSEEPGCPRPDDAVPLLERMIKADVVLLASPVFCWDFTAQLKPLIDRTYCLVTEYGSAGHKSMLEGKRMAMLLTCAGPAESNTDLVEEIFRRYIRYTKTRFAGQLVVPNCKSPKELGEETRRQARDFASSLAAGAAGR